MDPGLKYWIASSTRNDAVFRIYATGVRGYKMITCKKCPKWYSHYIN